MILTPATLTVSATAYCLRGRTADGSPVSVTEIAVDRHIIPLGTRVRILTPPLLLGQGARIVAAQFRTSVVARDTGSAIVGHRIDVWTPSCSNAFDWGRHDVTLVLERTPHHHARRVTGHHDTVDWWQLADAGLSTRSLAASRPARASSVVTLIQVPPPVKRVTDRATPSILSRRPRSDHRARSR